MGIKERLLNTYRTRVEYFKSECNVLKDFIANVEEYELCDSEFDKLFTGNDFICIIHNRVYFRDVVNRFSDNLIYSCFVIELFNSIMYATDVRSDGDCIIKNIYGFSRDLSLQYYMKYGRYRFYKKCLMVIVKADSGNYRYDYNYDIDAVEALHDEVEGALRKFGYKLVPGVTVNKILKYVELHIADNIQVDIENNGIVRGNVLCNVFNGSTFSQEQINIFYSYNTNKILTSNDIRLYKYNENLEVLKELSEWGEYF